jgi:hypothetical protein
MRYGIHLAALAAATTFQFLGACFAAGNSLAYPLKPSPSGRYLIDQNDIPFLILGDSPQAAIGKLSPSNPNRYSQTAGLTVSTRCGSACCATRSSAATRIAWRLTDCTLLARR